MTSVFRLPHAGLQVTCALLLVCLGSLAQAQGQNISGTVTDISANPVPRALVCIGSGEPPSPTSPPAPCQNQVSGTTDQKGQFTLSLPASGPYWVRAHAAGFRDTEAEGLFLVPGAALPILLQRQLDQLHERDQLHDATIVYDVPAREIKCWFDGLPPSPIGLDPCKSQHGHEWQKGQVYFYHGQTIHLIYTRAMFTDKMVANPTGTATPEPPIPVYGSGTALPTLSGLIPLPSGITGPGTTAVTPGILSARPNLEPAPTPEHGFDLYSVVDRLDSKAFATFLNNRLIGPASSANLQTLVAPDLPAHLRETLSIFRFSKIAHKIQEKVDAAPGDQITDFDCLIERLRAFNLVLNDENDFQQQFNSSGVGPHAQAVLNATLLSKDPQLQVLRDIVDVVKPTEVDITARLGLDAATVNDARNSWVITWGDDDLRFACKADDYSSALGAILHCPIPAVLIPEQGTEKVAARNEKLGFSAKGEANLATNKLTPDDPKATARVTYIAISQPVITMAHLNSFRKAFREAFSPRSWIDQLDVVDAGPPVITVVPKVGDATSNKYTLTQDGGTPKITSLTVINDATAKPPAFVTISIKGTGFSSGSVVQANGNPVPGLYLSEMEMRASIVMPGGKALTSDSPPLQFAITVGSGTSTSTPASLALGNWGGPTISFVSLDRTDDKTTLTISGTGLDKVTTVNFGIGSQPIKVTTNTDKYTRTVTVNPAPRAGAVDVSVVASGGTSNSVRLTIDPATTGPVIRSVKVEPQSDGSYKVTVRGSGFGDGQEVRWNGTSLSTNPPKGTTVELVATIAADQKLKNNGQYVFKTPRGAAGDFLDTLNKSGQQIDSQSLANLKTNLNTIVDHWEDIGVAETRTIAFNEAFRSLNQYENSPLNIMDFQHKLATLTSDTVAGALVIVNSAQDTPLPDKYRQATIGRWTANTQVQLTLTRQVRMVLPNITNIATNGSISVFTAPGSTPTSASFVLSVIAPTTPPAAPTQPQNAVTIKTETTSAGTTTTTTVGGNPPGNSQGPGATSPAATAPGALLAAAQPAGAAAAPAAQPAAPPAASAGPASGGGTPAGGGSPAGGGGAPQVAGAGGGPQSAQGNPGGGQQSAQGSPGGTPSQSGQGSGATPDDTESFSVHDRYHFRLGAGFVWAHSPDNHYQVFSQTPTGAGGASGATASGASGLAAQQFITQTRARNYNLLLTADLMIYPFAQDMNEWVRRYSGDKRPPFWKGFAGLIGFSVTSPSTDFVVGGSYFPFHNRAIGLKFGEHLGLRNAPPAGVPYNTPQMPPIPLTVSVVVLKQQLVHGIFVGLVFDQQLFTTIFGSIFK